MSKIIKSYRCSYTRTWADGSIHEFSDKLDIMDFGDMYPNLVAHTFNSDNDEFCKMVCEALSEFKVLTLVMGVTGRTRNNMSQEVICRRLKEMLGERLSWKCEDRGGYTEYTYTLADA